MNIKKQARHGKSKVIWEVIRICKDSEESGGVIEDRWGHRRHGKSEEITRES